MNQTIYVALREFPSGSAIMEPALAVRPLRGSPCRSAEPSSQVRVSTRLRHTVGYDRWETGQELAILESNYVDLRLYINFFQPSFKLIAKERIGNQTIRRYDTANTPYQRALERKDISLEAKTRLMNLYLQLNPAELRLRIDQKPAKPWKISR